MESEVGQIGVDTLSHTNPPFFQHQFFPGGGGKTMHPSSVSLSGDCADAPWTSSSNWDRHLAQEAEGLPHRMNWGGKAWNWDNFMFVAQPASGVGGGSTPEEASDANEDDESELRSKSFFGKEIPSPRLNEKRSFIRDDASPEEVGSLSLKLGGDSYSYAEENGSGARTGKRYRSSSPQSQFPMCQVDDCRADLSKAKDYHRRHKVCEMHSKAAKAPVSRLMQRFCQQCSRFHPLPEFDEGKRSCRRRLAGHNRRRRKTQPEAAAARAYLMADEDRVSKGSGLASFLDILSHLQATSSLDRVSGAVKDREVLLQCLKKAGTASTILEDLSKTAATWSHLSGNPDPVTAGVACRPGQTPPTTGHATDLAGEAQALLSRLAGPSTEALSLLLQNSLKGQTSVAARTAQGALEPALRGVPGPGPLTLASTSQTEAVDSQAGPSQRYIDHTTLAPALLSSPMYARAPRSLDLRQSPSRSSMALQQLKSTCQGDHSSPNGSPLQHDLLTPAGQRPVPLKLAVESRSTANRKSITSPDNDSADHSIVDKEGRSLPTSLGEHDTRLSHEAVSPYSRPSIDLQQPPPQQLSENSQSGSEQQSPGSSDGDWQGRTGRISFKLFDRNPAEFPQSLRTQILEWLAHRPSDMESYIRPGCIILTIFLAMPKSAWSELDRNLRGSLEKLLNIGDDGFWRKGRILVQVENQTALVVDGEIYESRFVKLWSHSYIQSVRPIAIVAGQQTNITLRGLNLTLSGTRILCAYQGKYMQQEVCDLEQDQAYGPVSDDDGADDSEDDNNSSTSWEATAEAVLSLDQSFTFPGGPSDLVGRCFIEVEQDCIGGNLKPVIVAESPVCTELRTLEEEIENAASLVAQAAQRDGLQPSDIMHYTEVARWVAEEEVTFFLHELGWFFQRSNFWQMKGAPVLDMFPATQLHRLMVFSVERDWCAVVRKLLNILFGVLDADAAFSGLSPVLQEEVSLLHRAVRRKCRPMVELLLAYVPSCLSSEAVSESELLHRTMQFKVRWGRIFRPNMAGPAGLTPLHIAASMQDTEEVVDALTSDPFQVGLHAWVSHQDESGETPLSCALAAGNFQSLILVRGKLAHLVSVENVTINIPAEARPQVWDTRSRNGMEAEGLTTHTTNSMALELSLWANGNASSRDNEPSKAASSFCKGEALARYPATRHGFRGRVYRPFVLSLVAIATVCVVVCLLFKGPPQILFVLPPFLWENVKYGPQ